MGKNVILLVVSTLCPITIMITALVIWKLPAEYKGMGYHTAFAEKNPQTWAAAQYYFGKIGFFTNLAAFVLTIIAFIPVLVVERFENAGGIVNMIVMLVQLAVISADVLVTERLLRKHFDKEGNPKQ